MYKPYIDVMKLFTPLPNINDCKCGSSDIAICEKATLGIQNYAMLKCAKCGREIKRRTYRKAEKAWNKNNPKIGGK